MWGLHFNRKFHVFVTATWLLFIMPTHDVQPSANFMIIFSNISSICSSWSHSAAHSRVRRVRILHEWSGVLGRSSAAAHRYFPERCAISSPYPSEDGLLRGTAVVLSKLESPFLNNDSVLTHFLASLLALRSLRPAFSGHGCEDDDWPHAGPQWIAPPRRTGNVMWTRGVYLHFRRLLDAKLRPPVLYT